MPVLRSIIHFFLISTLTLASYSFAYSDSSKSTPQSETSQSILGGDSDETVSLYQLNYALLGSDTAKTFISVKFRPFTETPFYLTYSNLLLWDIFKSSSPYRDANFIMEAFYRRYPGSDICSAIDIGAWHNSNGMDEEESRAWERAFIRFNLRRELKWISLIGSTSFYAGIRTSSNNGDISDYLGFWDLSLVMRPSFAELLKDLDFQWIYNSGDHGNPFRHGSHTIGISYGFTKWRVRPYIYVQYFVGYGEVMLDYNRSTEEIRGGFAFHY